jgi:hypothetical protein
VTDWHLAQMNVATALYPLDDPLIADFVALLDEVSVWESVEALFEFVYKSSHRLVMTRRREWFGRPQRPYQVLWWVPAGKFPTVVEGLARLAHLDVHGPTAHAFTFRQKFPPPGSVGETTDLKPDPYCVGWR